MDTWLEIDLNKLANNFNYMKAKAKTKIISVVKANAYGMGSARISQELEKLGTDMFAVATYAEAEELRKNGITKEVLILNEINSENIKNSLNKNYILTIFNVYYLKKWIYEIGDEIKNIKFHLKVDTGMNRLGIKKDDIQEISNIIKEYKLNIEGIYSHFADAESNSNFTKQQYSNFIEIIEEFSKNKIEFKYKHLANSATVLNYDCYNLDFVRVGMALYGLQPLIKKDNNINEIFIWKSRIIEIKDVKTGERVSYSSQPLREEKRIAVIPVGYAHGYMRQLSDRGYVLCRGEKCKIIGKVCMEKILIDVSGLSNCKIEDEAILFGNEIEMEENSNLAFTIGDDIISKISDRIERVYL